MRIKLIAILILAAFVSKADWVEFKPDSMVTIKFPYEPNLSDTLDIKTYYVETDYGLMYMTRTENSESSNYYVNINDSSDLYNYYRGIISSFHEKENCIILDTGMININNLIGLKIRYRINFSDSSFSFQESHTVYLNGITYSFIYLNKYEENEALTAEKNNFFSSISFNTSSVNINQLDGKSNEYRAGESVGKILAIVLVIIIPSLLILYFVKRKRNK